MGREAADWCMHNIWLWEWDYLCTTARGCWISDVPRYRSTRWATITARQLLYFSQCVCYALPRPKLILLLLRCCSFVAQETDHLWFIEVSALGELKIDSDESLGRSYRESIELYMDEEQLRSFDEKSLNFDWTLWCFVKSDNIFITVLQLYCLYIFLA